MSTLSPHSAAPHVIVAGAGSGGLAAALAAYEAGAAVSVYEAGEQSDVGGNARYSGDSKVFLAELNKKFGPGCDQLADKSARCLQRTARYGESLKM